MIPQLSPTGPGGPGLQISSAIAQERSEVAQTATLAEPLTTAAVETPRPPSPVIAAVAPDNAPERQPVSDLLPPDPNAPAGPPPSFEASILDRAREFPAAVVKEDAPEPVSVSEAEPYQVPPSRSERAAEQITTLRRIETPYDTATIDVSR